MRIPVVDENDNILYYKDRTDRNSEDRIRISGLWIINSDGELLISQRTLTKVSSPGKWTLSVSGTVEENENYLETIIRETNEELGLLIEIKDLLWSEKILINNKHKYFATIYITKLDLSLSEFTLQKDEVEQVKWININDLKGWYSQNPDDFAIIFGEAFEYILKFYKDI